MSLRNIDDRQQSAQCCMALLRENLEHKEVREALVNFLLVMPEAAKEWRCVINYIRDIIDDAERV